MTGSGLQRVCDEMTLRLIEVGGVVGDDNLMAQHLRSCLRCFRTAADMREVPRIASLLRAETVPDPGEAFWAKFPAIVAQAWQRPPARTRAARLADWLRLPVPAALGGAAVTAALAFALVQGGGEREHTLAKPAVRAPEAPRAPTALAVAPAAPTGEDEAGAASLWGDEDPWEGLDPRDLEKVLAKLGDETGDETLSLAPAVDDGGDVGPTPAEELELLDSEDLRAVAQALRARSPI